MRCMLAIHQDEADYEGGEEGEAWREILGKHVAFGGELAGAGVTFSGAGLRPSDTASTLRTGAGGRRR